MTEPTTPLSEEAAKEEARRLIHDAYQPTSFRDDTPIPAIGTAPPVTQPGRPPMSQGAVDASTLMLSGGVCTVLIGGAVSLVLYASGHADPVVCGIVFGSPAALTLAASRLLRRAKGVLPDEINNHYTGPVYQQTTHTENRGIWVKDIDK